LETTTLVSRLGGEAHGVFREGGGLLRRAGAAPGGVRGGGPARVPPPRGAVAPGERGPCDLPPPPPPGPPSLAASPAGVLFIPPVRRGAKGRGLTGQRAGKDKNPEDRAGAEAAFKRIAEAYEVLSDPERRAAYDAYGAGAGRVGSSARSAWGAPIQDPFDLFHAFFGGQDPFQAFFGGQDPLQSFFGRPDPFQRAFGASMAPVGGALAPMLGGSAMGSMMNSSMLAGGGGFQSTSFSSSSSMGMGSSRQVSSQTVISNGRRVTRTTTTVRHPDGTTETTTDEQEETGPGGAGGRDSGGLLGGGHEVMRDDRWSGRAWSRDMHPF